MALLFPAPENFSCDSILIRLEVEDISSFPQTLSDLVVMSGVQGASPTLAAESIGQRKMHDIEVETYSLEPQTAPQGGDMNVEVPFCSGIPSVEVTRGILHLYKPMCAPNEAQPPPPPPPSSKIVCVLSIPANQQLTDMMEFLSPVMFTITRLRVIRDSTPNQYMLLVTFRDKDSAREFYSTFNGRPFNSMEAAVCRLVFVVRVEIMKSSQGASLPPPDNMLELPSCPVCLERLDDSILTVLCNHSFHMQCISRWEDFTCPICRYTQTPQPCGEENICSSCDTKEDLWICLICGNIGCGRYVGGHANMHFRSTQHTFSMQLGQTQRVWDYIGDNYVHRLVQNKGDGKLVEVGGEGQVLPSDEKIDSLQLEYSYLLSSQLESQRLFFEEKMARIEKELTDQLEVVQSRCRQAVNTKEDLETTISELEKEKKASDKKMNQLQNKLTKAMSDFSEEKEMNKCLSTNQRLWRDRVEALEGKIDVTIQQKEQEMKELREQVRDLMFYLETQKKVEESPDRTKQELQGGQVHVPQATPTSSNTHSRKSRKKK